MLKLSKVLFVGVLTHILPPLISPPLIYLSSVHSQPIHLTDILKEVMLRVVDCINHLINLVRVGGGYSTCLFVCLFVCLFILFAVCLFVCLFVCVYIRVLPQNCCSSSIISKSKQATSHKLGNLRQTVVIYKTGKYICLKWRVKLKTKN